VQGCERPHIAIGFCDPHYNRFVKYGDPLPDTPVEKREPITINNRILRRVKFDLDRGCWIWPIKSSSKRYGSIIVGSRRNRTRQVRLAHVVSYETFIGPIPKGLELDHLCRNTHCVNPWHLEPVTHLVNMRRGILAIKASQKGG
jgi:hypothetical protein